MDYTLMYLYCVDANNIVRDIRMIQDISSKFTYKLYIERLAVDCRPMMDFQTHLSSARPDQCDIELLDQLHRRERMTKAEN